MKNSQSKRRNTRQRRLQRIAKLRSTSTRSRGSALVVMLSLLMATGCASLSAPSPAPLVIHDQPFPKPPASLMTPPLPSGAYSNPVHSWQSEAEAKLKALPTKSGASSPSSTK